MYDYDFVIGVDIYGVETLLFVTHPYDSKGDTCLSWSNKYGYGESMAYMATMYPNLPIVRSQMLLDIYKREYKINRDLMLDTVLDAAHDRVRVSRAQQSVSNGVEV